MTGGLAQRARVADHVAASFRPFTGFDPADGAEPHIDAARDNPCARRPLLERRYDLAELIGETIVAVEPCNHGWRLRCASGAHIVIQSGCTFDRAGNPVIEP